MSQPRDLIGHLLGQFNSASGISPEELEKIVRPNPELEQPQAETVAASVRGSRQALEALLGSCLVADQLAARLGQSGEARQQIESLLNTPFPARQTISIEFLDLLVARIQRLEACCRLLVAALIEAQFPSDRSAAEYVSASSADRRRT